MARFVPERIANEDLGDALEIIDHLTKTGAPAWKVYLEVASTVCWVGVNSIREVASIFLDRAKSPTK